MKRIILFFFFTFLLAVNTSFSQFGQTDAIITGLGPAAAVSFTSPYTGNTQNTQGALMQGTVDGDAALFYCVDIRRTISFPDNCHRDSAITNSKIIYILNNYYPFNPNPVGKLPDLNNEVAATQLAIWHFSDNVDLETVTNATLKDRAKAIRDDADANGGSSSIVVFNTIQILPGTGPDEFYVRTLDQNLNPMAINNIQLSISQGSLNPNTVNTDGSGNSPEVTVENTLTGTITAEASSIYPGGITYTCPGSQRLVIAKPITVQVSKQTDWGALPVELSAFTYRVADRNVTLNWSTLSETNNSGFNVERRVKGTDEWTTIGNVAGNGTTTNTIHYSYIDRNLSTGNYNYRLKQVDYNGNFEYHNLELDIAIGTPAAFNLNQNYPNPFNPSTTINFDLPVDGYVTLKVFNISGKEVASLVNEQKTAGYHTVSFNASNLSSGIYYYRLEANGMSKVMKMTLLK